MQSYVLLYVILRCVTFLYTVLIDINECNGIRTPCNLASPSSPSPFMFWTPKQFTELFITKFLYYIQNPILTSRVGQTIDVVTEICRLIE